MSDHELKTFLLTIQDSLISLHTEVTNTKNSLHEEIEETRNNLQQEILDTKASLHEEIMDTKKELQEQYNDLSRSVKNIEMTLEHKIAPKISALFDSRVDELRHRKENAETRKKVSDLEMRVDNLEKAFQAL